MGTARISGEYLERGRIAPRTAALLLGLMALPFIVGPLLAPAVFNLLVWAGRSFPALEGLRAVEFESVFTRCLLLTGVLMLWPVLSKLARLGISLRDIAGEGSWNALGRGLLLGILSMVLVPLAGLIAGAYRLDPQADLLGLAFAIAGSLLAGLMVALIEELIFRGMVFGLLRHLGGTVFAALFSAAVFSLVHFLNPVLPAGVVYGHWYSGFQTFAVVARSFAEFTVHIFPYSLTLFLIGLSLTLLYARRGRLLLVVGVHAGWITVLKTSSDMLARTGRFAKLFGEDMVLSKTYLVAIVAALFLIGVIAFRRKAAGWARSRKAV